MHHPDLTDRNGSIQVGICGLYSGKKNIINGGQILTAIFFSPNSTFFEFRGRSGLLLLMKNSEEVEFKRAIILMQEISSQNS